MEKGKNKLKDKFRLEWVEECRIVFSGKSLLRQFDCARHINTTTQVPC